MTGRIGPALKEDKTGNCEPYLSCVGCKFLRFHDWHYPYCGAQTSKNNDASAKQHLPILNRGAEMSQAYATAIKDYTEAMHQLGAEYISFGAWLESNKRAGKYWEVPNNIFMH